MFNHLSVQYLNSSNSKSEIVIHSSSFINQSSIWLIPNEYNSLFPLIYKLLHYLANPQYPLGDIKEQLFPLNGIIPISITFDYHCVSLSQSNYYFPLGKVSYLDIYSFYNWLPNLEPTQIEALSKYNITNRTIKPHYKSSSIKYSNDRYNPSEARVLSYLSVLNRTLIINQIDHNLPPDWVIPVLNDIIYMIKPPLLIFSLSSNIDLDIRTSIEDVIPFASIEVREC